MVLQRVKKDVKPTLTGAIIGDIAGSRFEFTNHKSKNFELFTQDCRPTDDTIMTLAIAKAIMETEKKMQALSNGTPSTVIIIHFLKAWLSGICRR